MIDRVDASAEGFESTASKKTGASAESIKNVQIKKNPEGKFIVETTSEMSGIPEASAVLAKTFEDEKDAQTAAQAVFTNATVSLSEKAASVLDQLTKAAKKNSALPLNGTFITSKQVKKIMSVCANLTDINKERLTSLPAKQMLQAVEELLK